MNSSKVKCEKVVSAAGRLPGACTDHGQNSPIRMTATGSAGSSARTDCMKCAMRVRRSPEEAALAASTVSPSTMTANTAPTLNPNAQPIAAPSCSTSDHGGRGSSGTSRTVE